MSSINFQSNPTYPSYNPNSNIYIFMSDNQYFIIHSKLKDQKFSMINNWYRRFFLSFLSFCFVFSAAKQTQIRHGIKYKRTSKGLKMRRMWGWKHHHSYEWSWGYQCQYRIPKSFCTHFEIWIHPFLLDCPKLYFIYDLNILPQGHFF